MDITNGTRATTSERCHCGAPFQGSDHCPVCYCEEFEAYCEHVATADEVMGLFEDFCRSCRYQAVRDAGLELTPEQSAHWSLWGCTCDSSDEAVAYMHAMTR